MARPRALSAADEQQLERLVDAGVRQELAGAVLGVSRRTVCRVLARRRGPRRAVTVEEMLVQLAAFDPVAALAEPSRQRSRRRPAWMTPAERLEALEAEWSELGLDGPGAGEAA